MRSLGLYTRSEYRCIEEVDEKGCRSRVASHRAGQNVPCIKAGHRVTRAHSICSPRANALLAGFIPQTHRRLPNRTADMINRADWKQGTSQKGGCGKRDDQIGAYTQNQHSPKLLIGSGVSQGSYESEESFTCERQW